VTDARAGQQAVNASTRALVCGPVLPGVVLLMRTFSEIGALDGSAPMYGALAGILAGAPAALWGAPALIGLWVARQERAVLELATGSAAAWLGLAWVSRWPSPPLATQIGAGLSLLVAIAPFVRWQLAWGSGDSTPPVGRWQMWAVGVVGALGLALM
jgi:hypothetical protein